MLNKKSKCLYCGNAPTNHFVSFCMQTIMVSLAPLSKIGNYFDTSFSREAMRIIFIPYLTTFKLLGLLSYNRNPERATTERSKVIWIEAQKRGIEMEQLMILKKPIDQYRAKIKGKWRYFESIPIPPNLNDKSYSWMDDKWKLKKFFEKRGIPVPRGERMVSLIQLDYIFGKLDKPLITKPELGSRGRHTTTHIYTKEDLVHGYKVAKKLCHFLIVEEMLFGSVYRATYVGGKIAGVLRGDPPRITGDGKNNIERLIEEKNKNKPEGVKDVIVDKKTIEFLDRQNFHLQTILPQGKMIDLSEKIGVSYGGNAVEMIEKISPDILAVLKKAGDVLNTPLVGFDFIIPDPTKKASDQKWGIIEANSLPFINLHHFPLEGTPQNVAGKIWDLWEI